MSTGILALDDVFSFMQAAVESVQILKVASAVDPCARVSGINSSSLLAAELTKIEQENDSARSSPTKSVIQALEFEEASDLLDWVDSNIRANMAISRVGWHEYLSKEGVDAEEIKKRICKKSNLIIQRSNRN